MIHTRADQASRARMLIGNPAIFLTLLTTAALCAAQAGEQHDWPQFHGPNRDNISRETGLLDAWPEDGPPLLWTADGLGFGYSSVSVANGMLYTAGNIDGATVITALSLDGKTAWRVNNGDAWTKSYPGTRGTPTLDGGRVYHQNPLGNVVCLDAKTGELVWERDVLADVSSENSPWGLAESLLINGGHVIACPGGPEACMVALDKRTGDYVWEAPSTDELAGYASPLLIEQDGLRIVVTLTATSVIGVNADDGALLWQVKHVAYANENVMLPIYHAGSLCISAIGNGTTKWRVHVENGGARLEQLWHSKELDNHHGGVILLDGVLIGTSMMRNRNQWVGLDWATGEKRYVSKAVGKGSLTYAEGMLYLLSIDRQMGLARPTPTGLEMASVFAIPEGGEGKSWAHPVVCNGRLYVRHGEFLYAYDVKDKTQ